MRCKYLGCTTSLSKSCGSLEEYLQKTIKVMGLNIKYLCMSLYYNQLNIRFYILPLRIKWLKLKLGLERCDNNNNNNNNYGC